MRNQAEKAYFFRVRSMADQSSEDAVFAIVLVFVPAPGATGMGVGLPGYSLGMLHGLSEDAHAGVVFL